MDFVMLNSIKVALNMYSFFYSDIVIQHYVNNNVVVVHYFVISFQVLSHILQTKFAYQSFGG